MGILNKILKENNLTPYSPELQHILEEKANALNSTIDIQRSELNKYKNERKLLLNSLKDGNSDDELQMINDNIVKLKSLIFDLNDEVIEIGSIKSIINYQSKLSGIKKEIGKLNQNDGSDLISKLKNKA
ncbi:MAG: hypothetical protein KAH33_06340 [Candidatus Delongbacteria bacterium]|nr:hypothetical protein [Candidatus Delongbacteria bacterium]